MKPDCIDRTAFLAEITRELADAKAETDSEKDKLFGMGYIVKRLTEFPAANPLEAAEGVIQELEEKGYLERAVGARLVLEAMKGVTK